MIVKFQYQGDQISEMADWLADHAGGPLKKLKYGGIGGPGWAIYHTSEMLMISGNHNPFPVSITKADISDPEVAVMFKLRWE